MISKNTIELIEKLLKLEAGTIQSALENEAEVDVPIEVVSAFKQDEIDAFKRNITKPVYEDAKKTEQEMFVKKAKKELGLDFEGKNYDDLLKAYKESILKEADKEPAKALADAKSQIDAWQRKYDSLNNELLIATEKYSNLEFETRILPDFKDNALGLPDKEMLAVFKARGYDIKEKEGKAYIYKNGEPIKNDTMSDVTWEEHKHEVFKQNNWVKAAEVVEGQKPAGRQTQTSTTSNSQVQNVNSLSQFQKQFFRNNPTEEIGSSLFQEQLAKQINTNKDFDLNS